MKLKILMEYTLMKDMVPSRVVLVKFRIARDKSEITREYAKTNSFVSSEVCLCVW